MRKLLWCGAVAVLLGGIYWTVGHGQVRPDSPVGRCLTWFHGAAKTESRQQVAELLDEAGTCCHEPEFMQAIKPTGFISVASDFTPMGDPDGNEPVVASPARSGTEPVREVVAPSEEVRLMPDVEEEVSPCPEKKHGEFTVGVEFGCPLKIFCGIKCDSCKMLTFSGMYAYLCDKLTCAKCPLAVCMKKVAPGCCKECGGECPAACKERPEVIGEMPVEVGPERIAVPPVETEESEPAAKPKSMSWFQWGRPLPRASVDTMEARPADLKPSKARTWPY